MKNFYKVPLIKIVGTFLNNTWVKEEISREILKHFEWNENEYITYQNLCYVVKIVLRGQFIALNPYVRKDLLQGFQWQPISALDPLCRCPSCPGVKDRQVLWETEKRKPYYSLWFVFLTDISLHSSILVVFNPTLTSSNRSDALLLSGMFLIGTMVKNAGLTCHKLFLATPYSWILKHLLTLSLHFTISVFWLCGLYPLYR